MLPAPTIVLPVHLPSSSLLHPAWQEVFSCVPDLETRKLPARVVVFTEGSGAEVGLTKWA